MGSVIDSKKGERPPEGYVIGVEYTREQINDALNQQSIINRQSIVATQDISGHGTAVAGIAAGNGRASGGALAGVAPESELIVVKINTSEDGFPRTTELMQGVDYAVQRLNIKCRLLLTLALEILMVLMMEHLC